MISLDVMTGDLIGPLDEVVLTEYRMRFLQTLARRPSMMITRAAMMNSVYWDRLYADWPTSDTLSGMLSEVRWAFITVGAANDAIITHWGEGWQMSIVIELIEPRQVRCSLCGSRYKAPGGDDLERKQ